MQDLRQTSKGVEERKAQAEAEMKSLKREESDIVTALKTAQHRLHVVMEKKAAHEVCFTGAQLLQALIPQYRNSVSV